MKRLNTLLLLMFLFPTMISAATDSVKTDSLVERGRIIAQVRCQACHFLTRSQRRIGPGLLGVYNRAPSISGIPFKVWNQAALEQWLRNPRAVKINTPMRMPPISARDRTAVIAWLKQNQ